MNQLPGWEALNASLNRAGRLLAEHLPTMLVALLLLVVGWFVGRLLRRWCRRLVERGLERLARTRALRGRAGLGIVAETPRLAGGLTFWVVFLVFAAAALEVAGLKVTPTVFDGLVSFLPRALVGLGILIASIIIARIVQRVVTDGAATAGIAQAQPLGRAAGIGLLLVGIVTAVDQMGIDSTFFSRTVFIVIAALLGGAALAFGLGARTAMSNLIASHYLLKTYRVGHHVRVAGVQGRIARIDATAVTLETSGGRVLVPAARFSEDCSTLIEGT